MVSRTIRWRNKNRDKVKANNATRKKRGGARFSNLSSSARKRGISIEITRDQYESLVWLNCEYCNTPSNEMGGGLDRKDSSGPYSIDNCVPCCGSCNRTKGDRFTYEEFKYQIAPVIIEINKQRDSRNTSSSSSPTTQTQVTGLL
jgi:hypothetical protein